MTAMRLKRYPSPSGGFALGKMGAGATMMNGWKNPYITDGLLAMWDGKWNAGGGVHNPNAATWKDLSGNGYDFAWAPGTSGVVWGDNYISLINGAKSAVPINSLPIPEGLGIGTTVEIVMRFTWRYSDNYANIQAPIGAGCCAVPCARFMGDDASPRTPGLSLVYANPNGAYRAYRGVPAISGANMSSMSVTTSNTTTPHAITVNGIQYSVFADYQTTISANNNVTLQRTARADADVACARLYSRALTADEIAANYAIDKERFGLS